MKRSFLALLLIATTSVHAASQEKPSDPQKSKTESLMADESIKSHVEKAMEASKKTTERRIDSIAEDSNQRFLEAQKARTSSQMSLSEEEFILKNVPPEIRVLGKKEIDRYVREHFVEPKSATTKPVEPAKKIEPVWTSSKDTLVPVLPTAQVVAKLAPTSTIVETTNSLLNKSKGSELSEEEKESIAKAKAKAQKTNDKDKKSKVRDSTSAHFEISRLVIMGQLKMVDISAELSKGTESAEATYSNLEEGSSFVVNKTKYTVVGIDKTGVTITDNKKKSIRISAE